MAPPLKLFAIILVFVILAEAEIVGKNCQRPPSPGAILAKCLVIKVSSMTKKCRRPLRSECGATYDLCPGLCGKFIYRRFIFGI